MMEIQFGEKRVVVATQVQIIHPDSSWIWLVHVLVTVARINVINVIYSPRHTFPDFPDCKTEGK